MDQRVRFKLRMDRTKQMQALVDQGWTLQKIGDKFGFSRQRVSQLVGTVGRRVPVKQIVADNIDRIMAQWEQGVPFAAIAREYGVSDSALARTLDIPSNYHGTLVHGTRNAYLYHKCRCQKCTAAGTLVCETAQCQSAHAGTVHQVQATVDYLDLFYLQNRERN